MTLADVAGVLNTSVRQVYSLVHSGELVGIQIGGRGQWRVENSALEDYIRRMYDNTRKNFPPEPDSETTEDAPRDSLESFNADT